jgi:hypothetical protein
MRFDAFILYGQCPNDEGQCTFSHDHPRRVWPCVQRYRIESSADSEPARRAAAAQAGWGGLSRADACGLCALWDLARLGVEAVKIVGRGMATERKAWAVKTAKEMLGLIEAGIGREKFLVAARERSRARFRHGCSPHLCYFPEHIPRPPAETKDANPLDPPFAKGDQAHPPFPLSQRGTNADDSPMAGGGPNPPSSPFGKGGRRGSDMAGA